MFVFTAVGDLYRYSTLVYCCMVLLLPLKLVRETTNWTKIFCLRKQLHVLAIIATLLFSYRISVMAINYTYFDYGHYLHCISKDVVHFSESHAFCVLVDVT